MFLTLHNFKDDDYLDGEYDDVDGGRDEDDVDVDGVKDYHGDAMSWDVTAVGGDICQSPDKEAVQCCQSYLGEEMQKSKYLCASAPGWGSWGKGAMVITILVVMKRYSN